jgi:hypothetical protein
MGRSLISILGNIFALLLGLTSSFTVRFVGDLPVAEVLVGAVVIPLMIVYRRRILRTDATPVFALMGLWLVGQILSDIYRGTPRGDWLRGDAAICFFALDLALVIMLMGGNQLRQVLFFGGFAVGSLLAFRLQPSQLALEAPWKFGLSGGANLVAVLISALLFNRRRYLLALLFMVGISAVNLAQDYRSPVLFLLLTVSLSIPVIPEQIGPWRVLPPPGTRMRLVVLASMAIITSLAAGSMVQFLSSRGYLGDEAQQKNEMESHVKGGILLGGRPEIQVSSRAVLDSPILGHGSWAKDFQYVDMLNDIEFENGMDVDPDVDYMEEDSGGLIPTHSHLMGAWVWAGVLGAVFWAYMLWLMLKATVQLAVIRPFYGPLFMFLVTSMVWDIIFSPFGTTRRITESVLIVIALDLIAVRAHSAQTLPLFRPRVWRRRTLQPALSSASGSMRSRIDAERSKA